MPARFSQIPAFIICGIRTSPVPNTIAFGGVPTGIMYALLAPSVHAMSPQPVTGHNLVAVKMRPVRPLSEGSVAAEPNIQAIRNAYKAELERVQTQGILAGLLFRHFFSGPHIFGVKSFIASIR